MRKTAITIIAGAAGLFPALAFSQHTAPGAPVLQGQQRHPDTVLAPHGSAPEIGELSGVGDMVSLSVSDVEGLPVVNEFGQSVGTVSQLVEGEAGRRYVVVSLEDKRSVIFPVMLMGVHDAGLVVQGYGADLLRAQTLQPNALTGFNPVHSSAAIEIPQVAVRRE